jgi:helicase
MSLTSFQNFLYIFKHTIYENSVNIFIVARYGNPTKYPRDALHQPKDKGVFPLLHMIASTPDMMSISLRKRDFDEMADVFYAHAEELLIPEKEIFPSDDVLSQLKAASVLMQWIEETHEDKIVSHFGIGPGDLRTIVELSDWLLYSSSEIGKAFGLKDAEKPLSILRVRVLYGIKEELLQLVALRGIGRVRARNLYNAGFKTLKNIKDAAIDDLEKVPTIGRTIAEDIKKQVAVQEVGCLITLK